MSGRNPKTSMQMTRPGGYRSSVSAPRLRTRSWSSSSTGSTAPASPHDCEMRSADRRPFDASKLNSPATTREKIRDAASNGIDDKPARTTPRAYIEPAPGSRSFAFLHDVQGIEEPSSNRLVTGDRTVLSPRLATGSPNHEGVAVADDGGDAVDGCA